MDLWKRPKCCYCVLYPYAGGEAGAGGGGVWPVTASVRVVRKKAHLASRPTDSSTNTDWKSNSFLPNVVHSLSVSVRSLFLWFNARAHSQEFAPSGLILALFILGNSLIFRPIVNGRHHVIPGGASFIREKQRNVQLIALCFCSYKQTFFHIMLLSCQNSNSQRR